MNVNILAFIFGALLLFVAIIGGGFELRELKVPKVGWAPRILALVAGLLFISLGFVTGAEPERVDAHPGTPVAQAEPAKAQEPAKTVDFTITDQLGEGQVAERVEVQVDGRMVGTLNIDEVHPMASITVTVPRAGSYPYELRSVTYVQYDDGTYGELYGAGNGQIEVSASKSFALVGQLLDDGTALLALE
jgi:hypothetical protein